MSNLASQREQQQYAPSFSLSVPCILLILTRRLRFIPKLYFDTPSLLKIFEGIFEQNFCFSKKACTFAPLLSPGGGIGRRATLRGWCRFRRASSSLVLGTTEGFAQMAELVDALVSGTSLSNEVQVRVLFWAQGDPLKRLCLSGFCFSIHKQGSKTALPPQPPLSRLAPHFKKIFPYNLFFYYFRALQTRRKASAETGKSLNQRI